MAVLCGRHQAGPRVKDEREPELQVTREPAPRGQMLVISVHYSGPLRLLRVTNVFTTVMAKMTACQSWQYFSGNRKMLEYWLTGLKLFLLCVAMHEDKQTALPLYFPFYFTRQNKCKKILVENLSASFVVSIWPIILLFLNYFLINISFLRSPFYILGKYFSILCALNYVHIRG